MCRYTKARVRCLDWAAPGESPLSEALRPHGPRRITRTHIWVQNYTSVPRATGPVQISSGSPVFLPFASFYLPIFVP